MKNNLYILLCFILQIGCNNASKEVNKIENSEKLPLDVFKWLLGSWESFSPEGHFFETWEKENDFTYSGLSYMAVKKDTIFFETIKIITIEKNVPGITEHFFCPYFFQHTSFKAHDSFNQTPYLCV